MIIPEIKIPLFAKLLLLLLPGLFLSPVYSFADSASASPVFDSNHYLLEFSSPVEEWGDGVEAVIEEAYRACFKTYIIEGRVITVRMPFAENNERAELIDGELIVKGGGKADAQLLWLEADQLLGSADFKSYAAILGDGREKLLTLDLDSRSWKATRDLFSVARMKADAYPGLPHQPLIYSDGKGIKSSDVYNYLYCVGRLGMDCSGFVWQVLSTVAQRSNINLSRALAPSLHAPGPSYASLYFGTWYFNKKKREAPDVPDLIRNLKPLDLILFRGEKGGIVHSTVIQSIDRKAGIIRYLQSTDEAPMDERGVHESFIHFDPENANVSLKDPSLIWTQKRLPPFDGERPSPFMDDGERYRAFAEYGGGKVVRIKALSGKLKFTYPKKQP
ncbi:MAG: peptidoglycan endopeptidase [Spirochaetia bacterium]|nr:peptidoglycan endopeptidase [Spirochaetia bacterium]